MSSDLVGFSAFLLIALSSVVLMMTSVATWWRSRNMSNGAGVSGPTPPCEDRAAARWSLTASTAWGSVLAVLALVLFVVSACAVVSEFSPMGTPILPAGRIVTSLSVALLAGLVVLRLWFRRQRTAS